MATVSLVDHHVELALVSLAGLLAELILMDKRITKIVLAACRLPR